MARGIAARASIRRPAVVAFVHRGRDWVRGSEQCLLDLAAGLDRSRFTPLVWCNTPMLAAEARRRGVEVELVDDWADGRVPFRTAAARARIAAMLRARAVDLVHANVVDVVGALLPSTRRLRIPLAVHLHMPVTELYARRYSLVHQVAAAVGVADNVVRPLIDDGMNPRRVRVIYNAYDADRLMAGDARGLRADLGIPAAAVVAVTVGSLIVRKGHDVTIEAVALARAAGADVHLLVCGDGEEAASLRARARRLGVESAVHFLGYRRDAGAVMRDASDLLVTSAREEAMPLNVIEAQALGLPVIASDIAPHRDGLEAGVTGLLAAPEDAHDTARAIVQLARAPEQRRTMGNAGRARAEARFSMARYVREFEALYDELLGRPRDEYGWAGGSAWPPVYTRWIGEVARNRLRMTTRRARA